MSEISRLWWADAVVYQVYPRSFADGDGDGVGDLAGLRDRLPYLADLGVDAIWLTPFYPSPLVDGGYDVTDYCDVDPRLGTLGEFDAVVETARAHRMRVLVDLVPNHCAADHPLFRQALAARPGSSERELFIFRDGRGPDGSAPPNNWPSGFGGPAWTRVSDGQWYLHLYDPGQPDWNWRDPRVLAMFEDVIRFWLDRGAAGLRVDVAHGVFKDPDLADAPTTVRTHVPSGYYHRPELHGLYRSWRRILDSYPAAVFPGERTAVGEVWYDTHATLRPYLAPDGLPQVFNFELVTARWDAARIREAIDATLALPGGGSRAPWVLGNHDVVRPVTRFGPGAARVAALLLFALPGSAYLYQGEELGLPEVLDIPDAARQDPTFRRTEGKVRGRDGCRVPLPWDLGGDSFGFSRTGPASSPAPPWLPQPADWGRYSVAAQREAPDSFLRLYTDALRLRRAHPALGAGGMRWLAAPDATLVFARDPGFLFAANLGDRPVPLPPHREVLLASSALSRPGELPPDTAVWLDAGSARFLLLSPTGRPARLPAAARRRLTRSTLRTQERIREGGSGACSGTAKGRDPGGTRDRAQPAAGRRLRGRVEWRRSGDRPSRHAERSRRPDQGRARRHGFPGARRRAAGVPDRHDAPGGRRPAALARVPQRLTPCRTHGLRSCWVQVLPLLLLPGTEHCPAHSSKSSGVPLMPAKLRP